MNEFTKQELILLACWSVNRCQQIGDDNAEYEGTMALSHKIQSMIINYCEHEWENICCQCTLDKIHCYKCEKNMGDLKERYPNAN